MSMLKNLATDASIAGERDSLGGSRVLNSALYLFTVVTAYIKVAASGAMALELSLKSEGGDLKQSLWMTGGKAKGSKNYYEKDGKKTYLPGFLLANSLALLTTGKELSELDTEKKVTNVYSADAKKEVPTQVDMVMDLIGKEIYGGVLKLLVDKTKKDDNGDYQPTGESREDNELDKFFRGRDKLTVAEITAGVTDAVFANQWAEKFTGTVRDKTTKDKSNGTAGAPRAGKAGPLANGAGGASKPSSLFA